MFRIRRHELLYKKTMEKGRKRIRKIKTPKESLEEKHAGDKKRTV